MFGLTRAPELDRNSICWFNVEHPLSLASLRGRLVILDFWTFCCINCLHVIPTLKRIEETFPDEVVVIGVHSPKFTAEREAENVGHAIARYDIRHPVLHDPELILWDEYAVRAWPTLALIGPDGNLVGALPGEPHPDRLMEGLAQLLEGWRAEGLLKPAPLALPRPAEPDGTLRFPGKIKSVADGPLTRRVGGPLWAVADAGHHQIVVLDDNGAEVVRYGTGTVGCQDAPGDEASFCRPEGLVCSSDAIFVADTGNHLIRRIDQASGAVTTIAGTGCRGVGLCEPEPALATPLASPWDLEISGHEIYFANAGSHQIGVLDLEAQTVAALAGSSAEHIADGPALEAQLAQPSGLALDAQNRRLYFADSETSAIRCVSLDGTPRVDTLVGTGLFDFGHENGPFEHAQFQHPLGVAVADGVLVVADSFNSKVRLLDLERRTVSDLDDGSFACSDPVCRPACEPAGVAVDGSGRLLIADTNNHRIVEANLSDQALRTWAQ